MISKIKKILLKIKRDNKSLHQIDVSEKFVKENFKFNINNCWDMWFYYWVFIWNKLK